MAMLAFCVLLVSLVLPAPVEPGTAVTALSVAADPSTEPSSLARGEVLAGKSRPGKAFTPKQKQIVKQKNAEEHEGKNRCENCDVETVPGKKHEKGVTPPRNETQVDHKLPKAKGGPGDEDNAQVLCRDCNLKKGSKEPGQEEAP
jgi:5-methylcytosine-specific restriction endonuclease McrA